VKEFIESRAGLILFLFIGLVMFSTAVVFCAVKLPANERVYLFLVGVAGNFSGGLFTLLHVKPDKPQ
jgi:hypothetical protein